MQNYDVQTPKWFDTTEEEILKQPKVGGFSQANFRHNIFLLRQNYGVQIVDYTIRKVPQRRSEHDYAVLLCVKFIDGTFKAKRYNKNQYMPLEYEL